MEFRENPSVFRKIFMGNLGDFHRISRNFEGNLAVFRGISLLLLRELPGIFRDLQAISSIQLEFRVIFGESNFKDIRKL